MTPHRNFFKRWLYASHTFESGFSECFKKAAYNNIETAEKVRKQREEKGIKLKIYKCKICPKFHLAKEGV